MSLTQETGTPGKLQVSEALHNAQAHVLACRRCSLCSSVRAEASTAQGKAGLYRPRAQGIGQHHDGLQSHLPGCA
eukprot:683826-Pelagomonas_calceolata.AAC.6